MNIVRPASPGRIAFIETLLAERVVDPTDVSRLQARIAANNIDTATAIRTIEWLKGRSKKGSQLARQSTSAPVIGADIVPEGRYAVATENGAINQLAFYQVDRPTSGKWAGYVFVKLIVSDNEQRISRAAGASVLAKIAAVGAEEASAAYGREIGHCGVCGRQLTNDESRERGIGPVCAGKMGWDSPAATSGQGDFIDGEVISVVEHREDIDPGSFDRFDDGYWDRQVQLAERAEDERVAAYKMARDGF